MIEFKYLTPTAHMQVGYIPGFLSPDNPKPAKEQFDSSYSHGGGWTPMKRWQHLGNGVIQYPGDNALEPIAEATLHNQVIRIYPSAWVGIFNEDGTFEVSRLD